MFEKKNTILKFIDSAIFIFIVIFLLSLSNSIFVNQVGYYGALLLILIKTAISKQNPFVKTGLEFALVWYILAEILSTVLSSNPAASFHNLLKHVLLIPVSYVLVSSTNSFKDAKTFFKIYIGATLITVLIYLYFSFQHYLDNLYGITESGPSIFQYPITASEILSFTVIFLFAFLVNEKTSIKNKILLLLGFSLSLLALLSTYKRTGWMGAAFGMVIILMMKKQWKLLAAGIAFIVIFIITQKNISEVIVYNIEPESITKHSSLTTEGKAYDVYPLQNQLVIADYNYGLKVITNDSINQNISFPSAAISFNHWMDDYYLVGLSDTRFILLRKNKNTFEKITELFSPGYTYSQTIKNEYFYVLDKDSGLTVFINPSNLSERFRKTNIPSFTNVYVDSNIILLAEASKGFAVYYLKNGLPTDSLIVKDSTVISFFFYASPYIFTETKNGLNVFKIYQNQLQKIQNFPDVKNIYQMIFDNDTFAAVSTNENLYLIDKSIDDIFPIKQKTNLGYNPKSIRLKENKLYVTHVESKQSRLLGIFDPYHPSNAGRLAFWRAGIEMFKDYPIFGVGDIDLQILYKQYKRPFDKEIQGHLHNNFFHILATLGLFGLLSVIYLFVKIILIDFKIYKQVKDQQFVSSYALGTIAAFCGFLISGLTELNFWDHEIATLIWFTFGLNIAFFKSIKPEIKIH